MMQCALVMILAVAVVLLSSMGLTGYEAEHQHRNAIDEDNMSAERRRRAFVSLHRACP